MLHDLVTAIVMGLVEGITEFLPVSSTGHLILVGRWLGLQDERARAFEIFIQLGAILAVVWEFRAPLGSYLLRVPRDAAATRLVGGVLVAFVPAAVAGLAFHHTIEERLFFAGPVAGALVVGGLLILLIEWRR